MARPTPHKTPHRFHQQFQTLCHRLAFEPSTLTDLFTPSPIDYQSINPEALSKSLVQTQSTKNLMNFLRVWINKNKLTLKSRKEIQSSQQGSTTMENSIFLIIVRSLQEIKFRNPEIQKQNLEALQKWFLNTHKVRQRHDNHLSEAQPKIKPRLRESFEVRGFKNQEIMHKLKEYCRRNLDPDCRIAESLQKKPRSNKAQRNIDSVVKSYGLNAKGEVVSQERNRSHSPEKHVNSFLEILARLDMRRYLSEQKQVREAREQVEVRMKVAEFKKAKSKLSSHMRLSDAQPFIQSYNLDSCVGPLGQHKFSTVRFQTAPNNEQDEQSEDPEILYQEKKAVDWNTQKQLKIVNLDAKNIRIYPSQSEDFNDKLSQKESLNRWTLDISRIRSSVAKSKLLGDSSQANADDENIYESELLKLKIGPVECKDEGEDGFSAGTSARTKKKNHDQKNSKRSQVKNIVKEELHTYISSATRQTFFRGLSNHFPFQSFRTDGVPRLPKPGISLQEYPRTQDFRSTKKHLRMSLGCKK